MSGLSAWLDRRQFLKADRNGRTRVRGRRLPPSRKARNETLLVVQELGPNSLDMQGVGSNQTVNGLPGIATTG